MKQKNNQKINKEQTQMTLAIFLIVMVLSFLIFFIVKKNFNKIKQVRADLDKNQTELNMLDNKLSSLKQAKQSYALIENQVDLIDKAIPNYSGVAEVMTIIEKLVAEVVEEGGPLVITSIAVPEMPNDTPLIMHDKEKLLQSREVNFVVSMNGDYLAVRDFITQLKNLRHNFYLEKITFSAPQDDRGKFLNVSLNIKYYYFTREDL